jgi:hypothetical protein
MANLPSLTIDNESGFPLSRFRFSGWSHPGRGRGPSATFDRGYEALDADGAPFGDHLRKTKNDASTPVQLDFTLIHY